MEKVHTNGLTVTNTKVSFEMEEKVVLERNSQDFITIWEAGKMMFIMAKEYCMVIHYTKAHGKMEKEKGSVLFFCQIKYVIMGNGKMIESKDEVLILFQMVANMKENGKEIESKGKVFILSQTAVLIKGNGRMI